MTAIRREHAGTATDTTLVGSLAAGDPALIIADASGWPTGAVGPFVVTVGQGTATEEKILVQSRTGTSLTVAAGGRGYDGTTDQSHTNGAAVTHTFSAVEADEANAHVMETTTAHGLTIANVVTLAGTQTLTNKTLTSPVINTPTGDVARGVLGYAEVTANQNGIGTDLTDLTGLTVTVTAGTSRRIKISANTFWTASGSGFALDVWVYEGTTAIGLIAQHVTAGASGITNTGWLDITPTAGSHTYKLRSSVSAGAINLLNASAPGRLLIEDIGAA